MRISDWSSDVCSSDLLPRPFRTAKVRPPPPADETCVAAETSGGRDRRPAAPALPAASVLRRYRAPTCRAPACRRRPDRWCRERRLRSWPPARRPDPEGDATSEERRGGKEWGRPG